MVDLSIIIVSYNTKDFLFRCLKSVFENAPKAYTWEIIVVDNASTDGSIDVIKSSKLKIISNEKNVGFSKANNIGVKEAKGRYILFLNSDTVVYPNTLEQMIKFVDAHKEAGAATCKVKLLNGKLDDACHRGFPTLWNSFCHFTGLSRLFIGKKLFGGYNLGWIKLRKIHQIDACAGAFMIVRKEAGVEVGWWDEDYFWYGDDLDFCYRLKEKGWKIYFVPTVSIIHYKGVSGGIKKVSKNLTTADLKTKKLAQKARFEAMRIFYSKHYRDKYPKLLSWIVDKGIFLREKIG